MHHYWAMCKFEEIFFVDVWCLCTNKKVDVIFRIIICYTKNIQIHILENLLLFFSKLNNTTVKFNQQKKASNFFSLCDHVVPSWSLITNLINYRIKTWLATWKTCLVHSWITVLLATRPRTCFVYLFAIRQDFTLVLLSLQKNSSRLSRIWIRKFFVKRMIILKISSTFLFVQRNHTSTKKILKICKKRDDKAGGPTI